MIKQHKWKILISSILILLPCLFGAVVWNRLPDRIPIHWNAAGVVDGYAGKPIAVFALPSFIFVLHWVCILATLHDNRKDQQNQKMRGMVFWITPIISCFVSGLTYATAFGITFNVAVFFLPLLGIGFTVIGNYLPKTKQNRTLGIKLPWTLSDEENWNKTHRMAGRLWVITGLLCFPAVFVPLRWMFLVPIVVIPVAVIPPCVYSYCLYKKKKKAHKESSEGEGS